MKPQLPVDNSSKILQALQYVVFGSIILYVGKPLFIPISFALLISFILYPICAWLERKSLKRITAILISMIFLTLVGAGLLALLVQQFTSFMEEWPVIKPKLMEAMDLFSAYLFEKFNLTKEDQNVLVDKMLGTNIFEFVGNIISASAFSAVLLIMVPVFSTLILYRRKTLVSALYAFLPIEIRIDLKKIIGLSLTAYYNFIKGMAIVYVIVGLLNSLGLWMLGIPHPFLFGFIVSILTFIPYIGIIIGSLLPIAMAWITFNSVWYPIGVISIFAVVQYLEANIIFPLAVSHKLKINALATLTTIIIGGILWGVAGMILFVPFLAIAKLIADNHPDLKAWSLLLGIKHSNQNSGTQ